MEKSPDAFRTISEVSEFLETPAHVLRFWESRFPQIKPVKRAGGRRYYRPADVALLQGIKRLLHEDGMTIRGVQKILREQGVKQVSGMADDTSIEEDDAALEEALAESMGPADKTPPPSREEAETAQVIALQTALRKAEEEGTKERTTPSENVVAPFVQPNAREDAPASTGSNAATSGTRRAPTADDEIEDLFSRFAASRAEADHADPAEAKEPDQGAPDHAAPESFEGDVEEAPMAVWADSEDVAEVHAFTTAITPESDGEGFVPATSDDDAQEDAILADTGDALAEQTAELSEPAQALSVIAFADFPTAQVRAVSPDILTDEDRVEIGKLLAKARAIHAALIATPRQSG